VKTVLRLAAVPVAAIVLALVVARLREDSGAQSPGTVVEKFVRHVSEERYAKATPLLATDLGSAATPEALSRWGRESQSGLGNVHSVRGETDWISGEEAEATAILEGEHRERRLRFALKREEGEWAIARLDGFWSDTPVSDDSIRAREPWRNRPARASSRNR
jgi:hypothetical protein